MTELEERLGYGFRTPELLDNALDVHERSESIRTEQQFDEYYEFFASQYLKKAELPA